MSNSLAVHYVYRPSDTPGHYDEALFTGDGPFPIVQIDDRRSQSNAVLENMPLVNDYDPDFVNVKPQSSGLVVAHVSFAIGFLWKNRGSQ